MIGPSLVDKLSCANRPLGNGPSFESLLIMGALAVAGEVAPRPDNPWDAPHTPCRALPRFQRNTGVRGRI
jgi:hypothetical protein